MVFRRHSAVLALLAGAMLAACMHGTPGTEITREHAIEIARQEVSFQPDQVEAVRAVSGATPVWRVTLRGQLPGQPPPLFETTIVDVHRRTGAVVSIARS